jgi:hypothetical protein
LRFFDFPSLLFLKNRQSRKKSIKIINQYFGEKCGMETPYVSFYTTSSYFYQEVNFSDSDAKVDFTRPQGTTRIPKRAVKIPDTKPAVPATRHRKALLTSSLAPIFWYKNFSKKKFLKFQLFLRQSPKSTKLFSLLTKN